MDEPDLIGNMDNYVQYRERLQDLAVKKDELIKEIDRGKTEFREHQKHFNNYHKSLRRQDRIREELMQLIPPRF